MTEAEQIMKRCQVGTRNYDEANNLHAACYGLIGKLSAQRQWVGLTDEERDIVLDSVPPNNMGGEYYDKEITAIAIAIETKLKEKNT
jgi:hypothetical protein